MSDAKFLAAKQLMQEGHYIEARAILKTMDHPTATKWLQRINELDPAYGQIEGKQIFNPSETAMSNTDIHSGRRKRSEQEIYYERENRRARFRNIGNGIYIILLGLIMLGVWALFSGLLTGNRFSTGPFEGSNLLSFSIGIMALIIGFIRIVK